jgi:hypothetical protein
MNLYAGEIRLLTPQKVQFKNILAGDTIRYQIRLKNESEREIKILRVKSSCKCTVLHFKPTVLKTNEEMDIPVQIDTEGFWGTVFRSVQIITNDKKNPKITVIFEMQVKQELEFEPRFLDLQDMVVGKAVKQKIKLVNNTDHLIQIENIESDEKQINIKWKKMKLDSGDSTFFEIEFKPEQPFSSYSIIYIHTNGARLPLFKIPIYIQVRENK